MSDDLLGPESRLNLSSHKMKEEYKSAHNNPNTLGTILAISLQN